MVRHSCDEELVLDITIHPEQQQNNNVQFAVCLREKQDVKQLPNYKTPVNDEVRLFSHYSWLFGEYSALLCSPHPILNQTK